MGDLGRWEVLDDLIGPSMCELQARLKSGLRETEASLGLVKPHSIDRLVIRSDEPEWSAADLERLRRVPLFGSAPKQELEKLPVRFTYEYTCNEAGCPGHRHRCTDWEMAQAYRGWRRRYGDGKWHKPFLRRFLEQMRETRDTHFYVGTHSLYPTWMVIGVYYPPLTHQRRLL